MLIKRIIIVFFIFIYCTYTLSAVQDTKTITVLPFINNGNIEYEKLSDYIASYIMLLLKDLPGYRATPLLQVKQYLRENHYNLYDLKKHDIIVSIADELGSDYIIGGFFYDEKQKVVVVCNIHKKGDWSMEPKIVSVAIERTDIFTLNESFDAFMPVFKEMTRMEIDPGIFTVVSDHLCGLYIDDYYCGETPLRLPLAAGKHTVRLVHKTGGREEVVRSEALSIAKGELAPWDITVFTALSINAEEKCTVFIDGEEKGPTPFQESLYTGRDYHVKVVYYQADGSATNVFDEKITMDHTIEPLYFSSKGYVNIDCPSSFKGSVGSTELTPLPFLFKDLAPGRYRVQVVLPDETGKKKWVFYNKKITVAPFTDIPLHLGDFDYKNRLALALIPSAAQFYNREPLKGSIVLSLFLGAAALGGIALWQWDYHNSEYHNQDNSLEDRNNHKEQRELFAQLFFTGIVIASGTYCYSFIDGMVTMNEINRLIHTDH